MSLECIPDETTLLNFRRLLEKYELAAGILAVINGYLGDCGLPPHLLATGDAVRPVEPVDGPPTLAGQRG
ncbi:hypothetical protein FQZ97_1195960 [compost metagenome]